MKKLIKVILAALILFSAGCTRSNNNNTPVKPEELTEVQKQFNELLRGWFIEDMKEDYLNVHVSLEHPENYGLDKIKVDLGKVDDEDEENIYKGRLEELKKFKVEDLTAYQAISHQAVERELDLYSKLFDCEADCYFLFTPNSGVNNNLITNYTEFEFRNEQDVQDFITILKDTGRYFDECIEYTKKQAEDGNIQTDATIDAIIEQCERFISKRGDNEIIKVACNRIGKMGLAKAPTYENEILEAVTGIIIPSYEKVIAMYKELKGTGKTSGKLSDYAHGKEYYELLFKRKTGCNVSVESMFNEMIKAEEDIIDQFFSLDRFNETRNYGFNDPEKILNHLKKSMVKDFPAIPEVEFEVSFLDPSVVTESTVAYYLVAPYDNYKKNIVRMNPNFNDADGLCITLAHEGYPGHLYQFTYFLANHDNAEYMYNYDCLGYTEGWAQYVEGLSFNYFLKNKNEIKYNQLDDRFSYFLYGIVDMGVHYMGWEVEDIAEFMNNHYFNGGAAQILYDIVTGDPGLYLPYSVGYYKMWSNYEKAMAALGDRFSLRDYNKVILDCGCVPFDVLEEQIQKYISSVK